MFESLALTCQVVAIEGIAPGLLGQRHTWFGPLGPDRHDNGLTIVQSLALLQAVDPAAAPEDRIYRFCQDLRQLVAVVSCHASPGE